MAPAAATTTSPATWAEVIRALAERHHEGHFYPIAKRLKVSSGTVLQWRDGTIQRPSPAMIARVCEAYELRLADIWPIVYGAPTMPTMKSQPKRGRRSRSIMSLSRRPLSKMLGQDAATPQALALAHA